MGENLVALRDRREQVIARLSECYATDVLDLDELDRRLDAAHGARSVAELDTLVADLAPAAPQTAVVVAESHAIDDPARPESKHLRVILGSVERRGSWVVPRHVIVRALLGSAEIDLREASIGPGTTTLEVHVTLGSLELIVPPWLAVDVDVSTLGGSVEELHRMPAEPDPGQASLRVVGAVYFGSVEIFTRLPGESARDARKRERRARRQRRRALRGRTPRALPPGRSEM